MKMISPNAAIEIGVKKYLHEYQDAIANIAYANKLGNGNAEMICDCIGHGKYETAKGKQ